MNKPGLNYGLFDRGGMFKIIFWLYVCFYVRTRIIVWEICIPSSKNALEINPRLRAWRHHINDFYVNDFNMVEVISV